MARQTYERVDKLIYRIGGNKDRVPTKCGISLTFKEWNEEKTVMDAISLFIPDIKETDHINQFGYWQWGGLTCVDGGSVSK